MIAIFAAMIKRNTPPIFDAAGLVLRCFCMKKFQAALEAAWVSKDYGCACLLESLKNYWF